MIQSLYFERAFQLNKTKLMERLKASINELKPDFLVCRGVSGLSVTAPLSYLTNVPYAIVRKPGKNSHSSFQIEGYRPDYGKIEKYLIIDDFIASDSTVRTIMDTVKKEYGIFSQMGILLYIPEGGCPYDKDSIYHAPLFYPKGFEEDFYERYVGIKNWMKTCGQNEHSYCFSTFEKMVWDYWQKKETNETNY